ncbi:MAG: GNAT family N-acetyltransferase [Caulobacteraceae bacterium]|nr:GNAT family N-acetyltransferase [Caulobacteraceae bacterium]
MLLEIGRRDAAFVEFVAALEAAGLPIEDLDDAPFRYFSRAGLAWGGVGRGEEALLRSVVVAPHARGAGHGAAIVEAIAVRARDAGARRLWLLTTDAQAFFARLGWRAAERAEAPALIANSRQFSSLCPASATLMIRAL